MYGPDCFKTFVVELGTEPEWPVQTTDREHTFACFTVDEAIRDVIRTALAGVPCRIVATPEWQAKNGTLKEYVIREATKRRDAA